MKTAFAVIGFVVVAMVVGTCVACNDDDDQSLGKTSFQLASHRYDDGGDCDWNGDCGDDSYRNDYSSNDRHRNERRNRGAFSPGPFDRSPVTIIICPPGTQYCGSDGGRGNEPPDEGGYA